MMTVETYKKCFKKIENPMLKVNIIKYYDIKGPTATVEIKNLRH